MGVSGEGNDYFGRKVGSGAGRKSLKDVCAVAYGEASANKVTDGSKPKQDEAVKYCSLDTATAEAS